MSADKDSYDTRLLRFDLKAKYAYTPPTKHSFLSRQIQQCKYQLKFRARHYQLRFPISRSHMNPRLSNKAITTTHMASLLVTPPTRTMATLQQKNNAHRNHSPSHININQHSHSQGIYKPPYPNVQPTQTHPLLPEHLGPVACLTATINGPLANQTHPTNTPPHYPHAQTTFACQCASTPPPIIQLQFTTPQWPEFDVPISKHTNTSVENKHQFIHPKVGPPLRRTTTPIRLTTLKPFLYTTIDNEI